MRHRYAKDLSGTAEGNKENRNRNCDLIEKYGTAGCSRKLGEELRKKWSPGATEVLGLGLGEG